MGMNLLVFFIAGKWHLGVFDLFRRQVYHPLNQGFDIFYGIPFTNIDEFGENATQTCSSTIVFPQIFVFFFTLFLPMMFLVKFGFISRKAILLICLLSVLLMVLVIHNLTYKCAFHSVLMRQYDVIEQPIRIKGLTKRLVNESVSFMEERKKDGDPFLVIVAWHLVKTVLEPSGRFKGV